MGLLKFVTEAFVATPHLASAERHDAYNAIKAALSHSATPQTADDQDFSGFAEANALTEQAVSTPEPMNERETPAGDVAESQAPSIRDGDTGVAPGRNPLARSSTAAPKQDFGPWRIVDGNDETTLYSDDFEHDVALSINGDFADAAQRIAYAEDVAKRLSATRPAVLPPDDMTNDPKPLG